MCFPLKARAHLAGLLARLPSQISRLTPQALLPDGIFLENRKKNIRLDEWGMEDFDDEDSDGFIEDEDDNEEKTKKAELTKETLFKRNPVAVLIKLDVEEQQYMRKMKGRDEVIEGGGQKEDEEDEERNKGESAVLRKRKREKEGGGVEGQVRAVEGAEEEVRYMLHLGFGNKEFRSNLEVTIAVQERLVPLLDWLQKEVGDDDVISAEQIYQMYLKYQPEERTMKAEEDEKEGEEKGKGKEKAKKRVRWSDVRGGGIPRRRKVEGVELIKTLLEVLSFNGYLLVSQRT